MAKQTIVQEVLTDDLDGSTADRTVSFSWEGVAYEIELSKKNATALEKALRPYIGAARKVRANTLRTAGGRRTRGATSGSKEQLQAIREWAKANGYAVAERGRIAQAIQDAYHASA